jgi:hypothetical protein
VRQALYDELVKVNPDKDWSFVVKQIGRWQSGVLRLVGSIPKASGTGNGSQVLRRSGTFSHMSLCSISDGLQACSHTPA